MASKNEIDHVRTRWEVVREDGRVKIRPHHDDVPQALKNIGAANPFAYVAETNPQADEIMQRIVDLHNAELKAKNA